MRFRRWPRPKPYEDTLRKRAAFPRKLRRECGPMPLFGAIVLVRRHDPRVRRAPGERE